MPGAAVDVVMPATGDPVAWRRQARGLLDRGIPPDRVVWRMVGDASDLFAEAPPPDAATAPSGRRVPRRFLDLAGLALCHRDPARFAVLYRLLWRLTVGGEAGLLADLADPDVDRARRMADPVRREIHRMQAFVRFRAVAATEGPPVLIAWFEPRHPVLVRVAPFFVARFGTHRWSILTPEASAHWDGAALAFAPGRPRPKPGASAGADAGDGTVAGADDLEALWRRYYASLFNPARVNPKLMQAQMPKRYWANLPEAADIPGLVERARERCQAPLALPPGPVPPGPGPATGEPRRRRRPPT
jgi:DNA polymerase